MTEEFPTGRDDDSQIDQTNSEQNETHESAVVPVDRVQAAHVAGREVVKLAGTELVSSAANPDFHIPSTEIVRDSFDGVFLGNVLKNGKIDHYIDSSRTITPDGFVFVVGQNSAGLTYVEAEGTKDTTVEAFGVDEETGLPIWEKPNEAVGPGVMAASDYGQLVTNPGFLQDVKLDPRINYGNPGGLVGVIRVTDKEGTVNHFALGASFEGTDNNWRAKGMYIPVEAKNIEALEAMANGTNEKLALEAAEAVEAAKPKPLDEDDWYMDRMKGRISPDPLREERITTRDVAGALLYEMKDTLLPQLMQAGVVIERNSTFHANRGLRVFGFVQPQRMADGREATLDFEMPADDDGTKHWGLKLKMAHDDGRARDSRGYTEADIRFVPASEYNPQERIAVSGTEARSGHTGGFSLDQKHENSMQMEVMKARSAINDADRFLRGLLPQSEIEQ